MTRFLSELEHKFKTRCEIFLLLLLSIKRYKIAFTSITPISSKFLFNRSLGSHRVKADDEFPSASINV